MELRKYNLTSPQKNIYLLEKFYSGSSLNNICGTCIIHSVLNFELLKKAIILLIQNNDNFKIHFELKHNDVLQYLAPVELSNIEVIDIADISYVSELENEMQRKVFDIFSSNNNFEFKIFRLPNNHGGYILNIHHLLGDSWALGLVARKITEYYNLLLNGEIGTDFAEGPVLVDSKIFSYIDYIHDEENYLNSEKYIKDEGYWNSVFETVPEIASIPSKFSNANNKISSTAKRSEYTISKEMLNSILSLCKEYNISIFNFFMSIYSIYLSKVSGVRDFVIGTPILNRCNHAQKQTLGMFVSTLPVRFNVDLGDSFITYAQKNSLNSMSMLRHQKYPYQNILENLRKKQSDLPNLYNILLSYQVTKTNTDGYNYETRWAFNSNCADDMQIHILDLNDCGNLNIYYDYKINKFDARDIENIHSRIMFMIQQILKKPELKLSKINIITKSEKTKITKKFNNTHTSYDQNKTIVDLFEEMVTAKPLDIAIVCNNKKITYDELNKKANQLANHLTKQHIGRNDLVGIMTTRSLEMVIGLIAILKLGASYIPVDPNYPEERVNYLIENSNSKALLVDNYTFNNIDNSYKINISLDSDFYKNENTDNLNIGFSSDSLMYLIYTSGSTGKPKGVMLTHKNVHNFLVGVNNVIDFRSNKVILSVTTMCFDIFGLELWGGLTNGLTVVIATEDEQNNGELLNKLCIENHVEMLQTTPSRMSFFLRNSDSLDFLKNLKVIMLGGEGLPEKIVDELLDKSPARLFNMYGPTETTIWSTIKEIREASNISIGTPIANTTCYILDDNLGLLPPYTPGILYIGGDGVSRGYFHLPEMTLKKFIASPYKPKELIYNTGDLAYYDSNGNIYHLGRNDFQVKLRGYRIELGEIENKILSYSGIKEACVIVDSNHLICYYTVSNSYKIKESDLISYLLSTLPDYMIPSDFVKLDAMPLTPNGKLDRKSLPKVSRNTEISELPSTNTERLLASVISRITKQEITNINESFISMGLDSLGIIQVQTELLSNNINLTTHNFYKYPTIKKLAGKIDAKTNNYNEQNSQVPAQFHHYPDEILGKISTIDIDENILGNVLLTGSNGFIGIHILYELLHTTKNKIYCLVRGENEETRINKLKSSYLYYFNEDLSSFFGDRIVVVGGDISYINFNMSLNDLELLKENIQTIINTAAIVKHYGNFEDFAKNNIEGTHNVVEFAFENHIRLVHLSSISVSGNYLVKQDNHNVEFSENDLYIGQHYEENNYVYSKMEAEKLILQYMTKGLTAKILRIGIVSGRFSDGFFQKRIDENAFYGRIKSIIKMHAISDKMTLQNIEFTPVDLCAKAIVTLSKNSVGDNKIYNVYNHNLITIFKVIEALKKLDISIDILNSNDFNNYILNLSKTQKEAIKGIINDLNYDEDHRLSVDYNFTVNIQSTYTKNYLHLLNFDWPVLDEEYLLKILKHMRNVGFI